MVFAIAAALPGLQRAALERMSGRRPCPVQTYRDIRLDVAMVNLLSAEGEPVRRRFNAYYGVRRNAAWRTEFYHLFEQAKRRPERGVDLFADTLRDLEATTGRIEGSFVSKLVATLDPGRPIIDSVVRRWLALFTQPPPFAGSVDAVIVYYGWLNDVMAELTLSAEARNWMEAFEAAFPTAPGQATIPAMKQLDFLIWAGAER